MHRARARALLLGLSVLSIWSPVPASASAAPASAGTLATTAEPASSVVSVPYTTTVTEPVAPGVTHRHGTWTTGSGTQSVELMDVNPFTSGITLEASYPARGAGTLQRLSGQAAHVSTDGHRVVAGVNGDTFTRDPVSGRSASTGMLVRHGELISGSRSARPTIGFVPGAGAITGDVAVTTTLVMPDGTPLIVDRVNKPRNAGDLDLYTERWGTSTGTSGDGTEVVLADAALPLTLNGSWTGMVEAVELSVGDSPIPPGSLVLSAQGADAAALAMLAIGQFVTVTTAVTPGWEGVQEAVSGREWLVRDGVAGVYPTSSTTTHTHPRTAVAVRQDGGLMLVTVDGRQPGESYGVTADDLAGMLVAQGAWTAINLDGGGSTTALARRPGDIEATVVNRPSDGVERAVDDGLLVVSGYPTGPLSKLVLRPGDSTVMAGRSLSFAAYGTDDALNGVPLPPTPISWSLTGTGATLGGDGVLQTQGAGTAVVTAFAAGLSGSSTVTILPDTIAPTAKAPVVRLRSGSRVTSADETVTVTWPAATDVGLGVAAYELQRSTGGGPWTPVTLASPTARSVVEHLVPGTEARYQVRAVDAAGNASSWRATPAFAIRHAPETAASVTGTWSRWAGPDYLDGRIRSSQVRGATASYAFTGSEIGWIAARGPKFGSAVVLLDGVAVATISLHATRLQAARLVYTHAWSGVGRHRITIRVLRTAGYPWVDVDGFAVVGPAAP